MARHRVPKAAADLLRRGFYIFPIIKGTKDRIPIAWGSEASNSAAKVESWSTEFPGCNWGIALEPSGFTAIDVDVHDGQDGPGTIDLMQLSYGDLPPTLTAKTASGGLHMFFRGACKSLNHVMSRQLGVKKTGVDVKSRGGYVVGAGSKTEAGVYSWVSDRPPAELPGWIEELTGQSYEGHGTDVLAEDEEADIDRATRWLLSAAPASVEGEGGHDNAYRVACQVRDMGLSEDTTLELMLDNWNERCEPPWDSGELAKIVRNAHRYARSDQGSKSAVADFEDEPLPDLPEVAENTKPDEFGVDPLLAEMNHKHSKCRYGGFVAVFTREQYADDRFEWVPYRRKEFDAIYEHRRVEKGDKTVPMGKWWREHRGHMRSSGADMFPDLPPGPTGMNKPFNLWCGWGVEPKPAPWPNLRRVVDEALCQGDPKLADYIWNWIAYLFQYPTEPARIALAFRGMKGTGKSTLSTALLKALGSHAMPVSDVEEITGRFNWHLRNKVFVAAEETKWMKNKSAEGALKSLITDPMRSYEPKGLGRVQGRNHISLILNSNEDWIVPASLRDERRFAVFDVDPRFRGDHHFWDLVYEEVWGDGVAGMLYDLLRRPIDGFRPWVNAPKTRALADQVIESLDFMARWWHGVLDRGEMPNMAGLEACGEWTEDWHQGPVAADKDLLYEDYSANVSRRYHPKSKNVFGRFLATMGVTSWQITKGPDRGRRVWLFPPLCDAREVFSKAVGTDAFDDCDLLS